MRFSISSQESPRISTVIPTYNRAGLIERAVRSALQASAAGDEVIVVDNGSTDNTAEVIKPYLDRVRYLTAEQRGSGAARNVGISHARNELVAFLDSDDEWMPGKLDLRRNVMARHPDVVFSFSDFSGVAADGSIKHHYLQKWHRDARCWNEILGVGVPYSSLAPLPEAIEDFQVHVGSMYTPLMAECYVFTSTVMVRRMAAGAALAFAEDLTIGEDWFCYGRLAGLGPAAYLDVETAWNHAHRGARATDASDLRKAEDRIRVLARVWGEDRAFLAKQHAAYRRVWTTRQNQRVRALLALGRTAEARSELRKMDEPPPMYQTLSALPSGLCRTVINARNGVKAFWQQNLSRHAHESNW